MGCRDQNNAAVMGLGPSRDFAAVGHSRAGFLSVQRKYWVVTWVVSKKGK
ncbi:hypothetical protein GCM10010946_34580 [Undibacterium squillarum]|uniref:Uncharacterized protein n=1 Tax=Undibacterium squillarum TaxID=1131567 RepID=A0ABQ2Y2P3_9BURK|nr:hypothetical protein GCM10010946_34580 [Undibacterium squillarum]